MQREDCSSPVGCAGHQLIVQAENKPLWVRPMFAESLLCVQKGLSLLKGKLLVPPPGRSLLSSRSMLPDMKVFVYLGP